MKIKTMQKNLYIIRHAKSSWENLTLDDFDRPLNKRGFKDAPFMAWILLEKNIYPEKILSSSAIRAKTTAKIFADTLNYRDEIFFTKDIYLTGISQLLSLIHDQSDDQSTIFLFGHNPELTEFTNHLSSADIENIPTSGIVHLELDVSWNEIQKGCAKVAGFYYPKLYPSRKDNNG